MITTTDQSEDRKENLKKLREFHTKTINELGVSTFFIVGKMCYLHKGKKVISFFQSEISKGQDIYVEFTNRFNVPEDVNRVLYRYKFNPFFEEECEKTVEDDPAKTRYIIPIDDLKVVKKYSPEVIVNSTETQADFEFSMSDSDKDTPISDMTIRDLAAILLQKPVSNKEWLNNIIKNK